jgi:hypothetical protein
MAVLSAFKQSCGEVGSAGSRAYTANGKNADRNWGFESDEMTVVCALIQLSIRRVTLLEAAGKTMSRKVLIAVFLHHWACGDSACNL